MLLEVPNPNDNDMGKKHAAVVIIFVALRHDDAAAAAADDDEADIESTAASIAFLE